MISPVKLTLSFICVALLLSNSMVHGLRGALYRSGRAAALPSGYQEFMRFGRSVPDQYVISRVQRASGGFYSTHDMIDPNSKMELDADDGQLLRFGK
uniref:Uncharacterized protein n=1 Tax=Steinernema glaseri TaxID=37863 RepID=A0A1I7YN48_9BILA